MKKFGACSWIQLFTGILACAIRVTPATAFTLGGQLSISHSDYAHPALPHVLGAAVAFWRRRRINIAIVEGAMPNKASEAGSVTRSVTLPWLPANDCV